ncbi:DnaJ domain-containing protein [Haematococcus lacustris]
MPCASVSPTCDDSEDADASSCTLYSTLGVSLNAGLVEISRAYRRLARMWHPDRHRHTEDDELAKRRFQRIQAAYEVLRDESRRGHYDLRLLDQLHVQDYLHRFPPFILTVQGLTTPHLVGQHDSSVADRCCQWLLLTDQGHSQHQSAEASSQYQCGDWLEQDSSCY